MILVQLGGSRGMLGIMLLDDADADLASVPWCVDSGGYAVRRTPEDGFVRAHRVVLERSLGRSIADGLLVDHLNGFRTDNRRDNLTEVTAQQNCQNRRRLAVRNKSGFKGVFRHSQTKAWCAAVRVGKASHTKHGFPTAEDADAWARAKRAELGLYAA